MAPFLRAAAEGDSLPSHFEGLAVAVGVTLQVSFLSGFSFINFFLFQSAPEVPRSKSDE